MDVNKYTGTDQRKKYDTTSILSADSTFVVGFKQRSALSNHRCDTKETLNIVQSPVSSTFGQ